MKEHQIPAADRLGTLPLGVGIPVGETIPDALVVDADGRGVHLSALPGKAKRVLLVFYRGGWCPFCNFQIHELAGAFPEFQRRGVLPVAISVDRAEESAKTRALYSIPFPVLSDPDLVAHRAFHVLHRADDTEVARLKGYGMDIERSSGRAHHEFAIPSVFLIDENGAVLWAHADPDYKTRPSISQLLDAVDRTPRRSP